MPISSYKTTSRKRIFQNTPYRLGVNFSDYINIENCARALINLDPSSSGDFAYPRSSFVNAILTEGKIVDGVYDFDYTPRISEYTIMQSTSIGPKFLYNFKFPVNEEDFLAGNVGDPVEIVGEIEEDSYGIYVSKLGSELSLFNNNQDYIEIEPSTIDVIDGDTIHCYAVDDEVTKLKVRLLGIDTQEMNYTYNEFGEITGSDPDTYAQAAKDFVSNRLTSVDKVRLYFDEMSEKTDDGREYDGSNRYLAYVMYYEGGPQYYRILNTELLITGLADLSMISDMYRFYVRFNTAYNIAKSTETSYNIHGGNSYPTDLLDYTEGEEEPSFIIADVSEIFEDSTSQYKHMKHHMLNVDKLGTNAIYDSQGFFEASPDPHDFGVTLNEDVVIQPLAKYHESQEYDYIQSSLEIPHTNMSWRNAITFIGRIVHDGSIIYKGLITIQYGRLSAGANLELYVLIQEPKEVNLASFNNDDAYSIAYNALDDDPFVFEDYFGTDANDFLRPTILGVVLYESETNLNPLKSVPSNKKFFLKPYIAIPGSDSVDDFDGDYIRFLINGKPVTAFNTPYLASTEGWIVMNSNFDFTNLDRHWSELSGVPNETIEVELKRTRRNVSVVKTNVNDDGGDYVLNVYAANYDELVNETRNYTVNCKPVFDVLTVDGGTYYTYSLDITVQNTDTGAKTTERIRGTKTVISSPNFTVQFENTAIVSVAFENLDFKITIISGIAANLPDFKEGVVVTIVKEDWIAVASSPILRYSNEAEVIDSLELFADHNLWNATNVTLWDRYLVLYGGIGNDSIQFSEYESTDFYPFPYGQIGFDSTVIHVHSHRGNLYVFTSDGIYILHSSYNYAGLVKTFAYSGVVLDETEKQTVVSYGNEVFFMSGGKGYVIRTNMYIQSQDDIYVQVLTNPLNDLLSSPKKFLRERFLEAYSAIIDLTDTVKAQFKVKVVNEMLHVIASYYVEDPLKTIMMIFRYDKDNKRWNIYDTNVGAFPIAFLSSDLSKRFDMLLANRPTNGALSYGSFLYELPEEFGQEIGDVASLFRTAEGDWRLFDDTENVDTSVRPIMIALDTGNMGLGIDYRKKVRRLRTYFTEISGEVLDFSMIPYADGVPVRDAVDISAYVDEDGEIQNDIEANILTLDSVSAAVRVNYTVDLTFFTDAEFTYSDSVFTKKTQLVLTSNVNLIGRTIGFKLLIPATGKFKIGQYSMTYKALSAR